MAVSDEKVASLQTDVEKLREKRNRERDRLTTNEASLANEATSLALEREKAQLEAEIANLESRNRVKDVRAASPIGQLEDSAREARAGAASTVQTISNANDVKASGNENEGGA